MTSQPDKLFRDKLEHFQRPAPAGAWNRIENNLARPAHKFLWLRVAAGVALLVATTFALWPAGETETELVKITDKNPVGKENPTPHLADKPSDTTEETVKSKTQPVAPVQTVATFTKRKTQSPVQQSTPEDSVRIITAPETKEFVAELTEPETTTLPSQTIVYTAEEVNAKFLKKNLSPQATPDVPEASGIQKLMGLAYAAKNSDAPLAELRQKKDDLLALNFSKKKGEN